jgi:hypothetical protein
VKRLQKSCPSPFRKKEKKMTDLDEIFEVLSLVVVLGREKKVQDLPTNQIK